MISMKYVGPHTPLQGCMALVRPHAAEGVLEVQFTDVRQRRSDKIPAKDSVTGKTDLTYEEQLMFGWHMFSAVDFEGEGIGEFDEPEPQKPRSFPVICFDAVL